MSAEQKQVADWLKRYNDRDEDGDRWRKRVSEWRRQKQRWTAMAYEKKVHDRIFLCNYVRHVNVDVA